MTDSELLALAIEMRAAQMYYYRGGGGLVEYRAARDLERKFDREVSERDAERRREPTLFDAHRQD